MGMTSEEIVRAAWACWIDADRYRHAATGEVGFSINIDPSVEDGSIGVGREFSGNFRTEEDMWSAAAAFTYERAEQIRQKAREIDALCLNSYAGHEAFVHTIEGYSGERLVNRVRHHHQLCRILSTLQQQYAELVRGMKPEWVESVVKG
jgi:hypothetical protein